MKIEVYKAEYKEIWNEFVRNSKNGTFLFERDFMEYHAHRFHDHSLLFYKEDKLVALMPGNVEDKVFYTHQGLTYGGLVMGEMTTADIVLEIFDNLIQIFRIRGIEKLVYKAIPYIYHSSPADEDLYALFRHNAILTERNISSAVDLTNQLPYSDSRKRGLKKAAKNKLKVVLSFDARAFWEILSDNLKERYGVLPVHSLDEIEYLKTKFPDYIHFYSVLDANDEIVAGCVLFETKMLIHAQYVATTSFGRTQGAVDVLIDYILELSAQKNKRYFDYGISNENNGIWLNNNLIYQKEGFGCRGIVCDMYTINL